MKFLKSKFFLICLLVAIVLALSTATLALLGWTGPIRGVLKTVAKPFEWCGSRMANAVNGFVEVFADYDRMAEENRILKETLESMENENRDEVVLREENAWLKQYLNLAKDHPQLILQEATVIARSTDRYSTVLTLNRGSAHG